MGGLGCITWREVEPGIVRLRDAMGFQCHLVVGTERALLVDTMSGHGDVRTVVRSITDLPVTVVATHSHYDHVAGAWFFDRLLLDAREAARLDREEGLARLAHEHFVETGATAPGETFALEVGGRPEPMAIAEGDILDLGGLTVEVVALPGHTDGSLGFLLRERRVLFTGDAVTPTMCLFFDESCGIETYRATLAKMMALPFDRYYTSHQDRAFLREGLADYDACAAFCASDPGFEWVHGIFADFTGIIHLFRGTNADDDDFLALIERDTPEARERSKRLRAERRAARKAARQAKGA
ncbi:MAG: MBL fold metallo-hydrolase [Atopobiaceae bacterium]|nr:MBL fold metallo-hydrolase [Atopobiaceae bacterium]